MSGVRFLVSLWEVLTSESIIDVDPILKENFDFWEEDISINKDGILDEYILEVQPISAEIQDAYLRETSVEVASTSRLHCKTNLEIWSNEKNEKICWF